MKTPALLLALATAAVLAACAGPGRREEARRYDFGETVANPAANPAANRAAPALAVGAVEVQARSWLSGSDMQYRLAYADAARRYSYADSRWAAPPAELLERALARKIVYQPAAAGAGCRLRLVLDDLTQEFVDAGSSRINLEANAVLLSARSEGPLAKRAFAVRVAAAGADARGGVRATAEAVQLLAGDLEAWLAEVANSAPAARCQ